MRIRRSGAAVSRPTAGAPPRWIGEAAFINRRAAKSAKIEADLGFVRGLGAFSRFEGCWGGVLSGSAELLGVMIDAVTAAW